VEQTNQTDLIKTLGLVYFLRLIVLDKLVQKYTRSGKSLERTGFLIEDACFDGLAASVCSN
jgi:hypothetical protein